MAAGKDIGDGTTIVTFYSYAGGAGRSCAVVNTGLILASQGCRVLIADLDLPSPSLYRYLGAFLPETVSPGISPVHLDCEFSDRRGSVDFLGPTTEVVVNPEDFAVEREDLSQRGYDFVLIDGPAGATPDVDVVTQDIPDVLIVGYTLNKQAMDGASQRARTVQRSNRGALIRLLPLPMRVDQRARGMTERMRSEGRRQFSWLLEDMGDEVRRHYWDDVEIPYEPDYAVEESLPFLDDSSEQRDRLVGAYARLADRLTQAQSPAPRGQVVGHTRARYLAYRSAAAGSNDSVTVLHAGADRSWGEWLVAELEGMGIAADRQRIDQVNPSDIHADNSLLLVVSQKLLALPGIRDYLTAATGGAVGGRTPLAVSIDSSQLPASLLLPIGHLKLAGRTAQEARQELASYYDLASGSATSGRNADQMRYPGKVTAERRNLPARAKMFHGREDVIDQIRDCFRPGAEGTPVTLTGPPGIGKSVVALEYAYRFAAQYDLIFFIRADSSQAVQAGLTELAQITNPVRRGDASIAALHELESDMPKHRGWLLIYDGADDPASLLRLLPQPGHGHVLLTSRVNAVDASAQVSLQPFEQPDADGMLMELIPGLLPADAAHLANDLRGIPLALNLAAAWIGVVMQRLLAAGVDPGTVTINAVTEFREQLARGVQARTTPASEVNSLTVTVALLVELLETDERGAAAICLLETCAFLSSVGMSQRLLRSPEMLRQLRAVDKEIADPVVLHNVLRVLATYGFSLLGESPRAPVQVHSLLLEVLRSQLEPGRLAKRAVAVAQMLAASAPPDIDEDTTEHADVYAELQQHLEPSGAWQQTDLAVRRWLVNQVRYLWQTEMVSAWDVAGELGERLADYWAVNLPEGKDDTLLLRLQMQLGNVYRSRCDFDRARAIDAETLSRQRRVLGLRHLRTLMTARGYAADLRLMGDFESALLEDQSTWQAFAQTLGDDHIMTLIASSNLALSELVSGESEQALQRQQEDLIRCQRPSSRQPVQAAWIRFNIGTILRELGRYAESRDQLSQAKFAFNDLVAQKIMPPTAWVVLRTAAGLAITERRLQKPSLQMTDQALTESRDTYGDLYPDALAMALSRAGALHAERRSDEAVEEAQRTLQGYHRVFGPNSPFTWLCQIDLSMYALAAGATELADDMSHRGWSSLDQFLGRQHLWSLAAAVARANALAITGRPHDAQALEEHVLAEYRRRMGPQHPFTSAVETNAAHTRLLLNESDSTPPTVADARRRQIIELDVPPY